MVRPSLAAVNRYWKNKNIRTHTKVLVEGKTLEAFHKCKRSSRSSTVRQQKWFTKIKTFRYTSYSSFRALFVGMPFSYKRKDGICDCNISSKNTAALQSNPSKPATGTFHYRSCPDAGFKREPTKCPVPFLCICIPSAWASRCFIQ